MRHQPTDEQKQAAQERREKFNSLVKQVAGMSDEQRAALSNKVMVATAEGHVLSVTNQILIAMQRESVTLVGGFQQWRKQGRYVRKGEHGMSIWIPRMPKEDEGKQPSEISSKELEVRFFMGTVFDISQTAEGETQA
jgi:hypothetical protein